jgi:sulfopropanediol 3-dehydrogenase
MEGHARSADVRLAKFFPGETFDLTPFDLNPTDDAA